MNYPITGNVSLGNLSGNIKLFINDSGSSNLTGFGYNNNCMTFSVNQSVTDTPEMFINQFGNVGIGTQTPAFPLDVIGNIRLGTGTSGNIRFGTTGVGTTQAGYIDLINNNMTIMNHQNGNIIFGTNNAEDMRISQTGNVGIGTQTPQFPLDVSGTVYINNNSAFTSYVHMYSSRPGFCLNNDKQLPSTVGSIIPFSSFTSSVIGNQSYLNIYKYRHSAGNDWLSSSTRIQQMIDDTNQGYIEFNPPNANHGIGIYGGSSTSSYGTGNGITVRSDGKVGIGTSSPTYQLQLSLDSAAKPNGSTWTSSSDIRIKENITDTDLDICYSICKNLYWKIN